MSIMNDSKHLTIKSWSKEDRPREKLEAKGAAALTDAELLAILIGNGTKNATAVDLGKMILQGRSLRNVAEDSWESLKSVKGIGRAKAIRLAASFELGRRLDASPIEKKERISGAEQIYAIYGPLLRDLKQEIFKVILLNSANQIIRDLDITKGLLNSTLVHPREVFKAAVDGLANSIILLHNHPSGNPEPSGEDIRITQQLKEAGAILGIPVHDHIIIAGKSFTSLAKLGHL